MEQGGDIQTTQYYASSSMASSYNPPIVPKDADGQEIVRFQTYLALRLNALGG